MAWPPEEATKHAAESATKRPRVLMALLTLVLIGSGTFGLLQFFVPIGMAAGWAGFAVLATGGIVTFNCFVSRSPRDNDGGNSPNRDAHDGFFGS